MFAQRVKAKLLEHRLDSWFYNPEALQVTETLHKTLPVKKLSQLVDPKRPITNGVRGPEWASSEFKLIRLQDCKDWIVDAENAEAISFSQFVENRRCALQKNDVVVAIGGYIGNASIVVDEGIKAVIGQHSALLSSCESGEADARFLLAYLNCRHAEVIFDRYVSGTVQPGVNLEDLRELPAPIPNKGAQKYIGDKVRQAEQLRAWAAKRYSDISIDFESTIKKLGYVQAPSSNVVWCKLEDRLDPSFYNPKYSFLSASWFTAKSEPLRNFIESGSYGVLPDSNSYGNGEARFIRATDLAASNQDPTAFTYVPLSEVKEKARVNEGDILLEVKGAIAGCEVASSNLQGCYVNGSVYRLTPQGIYPGYLAFYLRSFIKALYCERVSVNNIISYLDLSSIQNLPVIRLDVFQEEHIHEEFIGSRDANISAFRLTTAAKLLVEALIENRVTEAQLIAAQHALDAGDTAPDQALLGRLRTDGLDGKGLPLFADLDRLYTLLEQAEAAAV